MKIFREHHAGHGFRQHLRKAFPVILLIALASLVLDLLGLPKGFQTAALDTWLRVAHRPNPEFVRIVTIDDADYQNLFGGKSPLDPPTLRALIDAILAGQPAVLGVDLDTSDPAWKSLAPGSAQGSSHDAPPIVWARDAWVSEAGSEPALKPQPVLGRAEPTALSGLALFPEDWDGRIRRYRRAFPVGEATLDSFVWTTVKTYRRVSSAAHGGDHATSEHGDGAAGAGHESGHDIILNFPGDRYAFAPLHARDVLGAAHGSGWASQGPLRGKIVLLGGAYRAARDTYTTPLGRTSGVQLMAHAVESELRGAGIGHAHFAWMFLMDVLIGTALVAIHHYLRTGPAILASVIGMPGLALGASYAVFTTLACWASFVLPIGGILIHQLYDRIHDDRAEIHSLRAQLAAAKAAAEVTAPPEPQPAPAETPTPAETPLPEEKPPPPGSRT